MPTNPETETRAAKLAYLYDVGERLQTQLMGLYRDLRGLQKLVKEMQEQDTVSIKLHLPPKRRAQFHEVVERGTWEDGKDGAASTLVLEALLQRSAHSRARGILNDGPKSGASTSHAGSKNQESSLK